jgi:lycopene cyclase domain-containing protein
MVKAIALPSFVYLIWDVVATARGHWSFNPAYVVGIRIAGLPVEEVLFFPVISFITIFTWEAVKAIAGRRDQ